MRGVTPWNVHVSHLGMCMLQRDAGLETAVRLLPDGISVGRLVSVVLGTRDRAVLVHPEPGRHQSHLLPGSCCNRAHSGRSYSTGNCMLPPNSRSHHNQCSSRMTPGRQTRLHSDLIHNWGTRPLGPGRPALQPRSSSAATSRPS